jgi:predicted outer membrane repeat protein
MQKNFRYLDNLIHSGDKEIILTSDIVLDESEESEYPDGIVLDVDDLIIRANGHAIDARGKTRIFCCRDVEVTIKDIVLKNGAGAIYNFKGVLNMSGSRLAANTSNLAGGAIYNYWGEVNIDDSIFIDNCSNCHGGAIFSVDGAVNIKNSKFFKNTVENDGGAIFCGVNQLNIENSLFFQNVAGGSGGAIYANIGEINIENSKFCGNVSKGTFGGGAIHKNRGFLNVANSLLSDNRANGDGGAIFNIDADGAIAESRFVNNASEGHGTAIYDDGRLTIRDLELHQGNDDGEALFKR